MNHWLDYYLSLNKNDQYFILCFCLNCIPLIIIVSAVLLELSYRYYLKARQKDKINKIIKCFCGFY